LPQNENYTHENQYDAIIIGSGISGLTVGSILSQLNDKRVLILEKHFQPGGYTHVFQRKGTYTWDVGLHYVGKLFKGSLPWKVFQYITRGKLQWVRMRDPFEKFIYPGLTFDVPGNEKEYKKALIKKFPHEKQTILKYFKDVHTVTRWYVRSLIAEMSPFCIRALLRFLNRFSDSLVHRTTTEYLEENVSNPKLAAILVSQWGNYGLPPSQSSFVIHSIVVTHFLYGGFYPVGGSGNIAKTIIPTIEEKGGKVLTSHTVTSIIIENNAAKGVSVEVGRGSQKHTKTYYAPLIISSTGAFSTYTSLIPDSIHIPFRKKLVNMPTGTSSVTLYLGLNRDPRELNFYGENHWICDSWDHEKHFMNTGILKGKPTSCVLSFPSVKDPQETHHTATIIAYIDYAHFAQWRHQKWLKRERNYQQLKSKISQGLIDFVDSHYPGFSDMIAYAELGTPLSTEYLMNHTGGAMYGLASGIERFKQKWLSIRTPIDGLFLTGVDIASLGVVGSMLGGVATACILNGPWGIVRVFKTISSFARSQMKKL